MLAALDAQGPAKKTDMFGILRQVAEAQSKRGMIILISDLFADRAGIFKGLDLLRHRGHDVMVLHVMDDAELDFEYAGTTKFEGLEEMGDLVCDPRSLREGYLAAIQRFLEEVRRHCSRSLVDYQTIRTSSHLDAALGHYLNHRLGLRQSVRN
jgi:hypothetical protein